jgi:hypothetical protein
MAQINKIKLPNGNVVIPGDWISSEPLYSTVEISSAAFGVLTAFSYSYGGTVPGSVGPRQATKADTNLEGEGNRLPENEELIIYNIGVEVFATGDYTDTDTFPSADNPHVPLDEMLRLQRDLLVELRIANVKNYTRSPLSYWPAGTGVASMYSGGLSRISSGSTGEVVANNGAPSVDGRRELAAPFHVQGGSSLALDLRAGPGSVTGLRIDTNSRYAMRCYLDGFRRRPVA